MTQSSKNVKYLSKVEWAGAQYADRFRTCENSGSEMNPRCIKLCVWENVITNYFNETQRSRRAFIKS